jgi:class 3 adenylate cyclase/CHASE2 domain-containing sensor protein
MLTPLLDKILGASWSRFRISFAASLILSLAGVLMSAPATNLPFEGAIYDLWHTGAPQRQEPADRPAAVPIVVVAIDDATLNNPRRSQPEVFSPAVWAAVLDALVLGGAKAVAIHRSLPTSETGSFPPEAESAWFRAVQAAARADVPIIYGFRHRGERPLFPAAKYLEIMGRENLGFLDLSRDRDDKVRRQMLVWPDEDGKASADPPSFAWLAARAVKPDLDPGGADPFYIDFAGKPPPTVGFADVYEGAVDGRLDFFKRVFGGALVVIGETSSLSMDAWPTPISVFEPEGRGWSLTPDVEIQARAIATLLGGTQLQHPDWLTLWLLFFPLMFLTMIPVLLSVPRGRHFGPWVPALILALYPVAAFMAFRRQVYLPVIPGLAILVLANIFYLGLRARETKLMQRAGSQALNLYLNPALAGQIILNPEVLERKGEVRPATVLFADLVGFTALAETMETARLVDLINRYFETMNTAIERYDGFVDKFMGDGLMAVWGAPSSQPLHAVSACLSALMQKSLMERLNRDLAASGQPTLQALMGLSTGEVVAGNVGASQRLNYTVMGDVVNLASRLVSVNKLYRTTILASEATATQARDQVLFRAVDRVRVKGRKGSITVHEVLAPAGALGDRMAQCANYFERALRHYWDRDFPGALARVEAALKTVPDDPPSLILAHRCREYITAPPGPDWDGVTVLEAK